MALPLSPFHSAFDRERKVLSVSYLRDRGKEVLSRDRRGGGLESHHGTDERGEVT